MSTTEKGMMLLFFAPDYGSLSELPVCTLASQKFEKHVEVVWTACCQPQGLCALCDMTG